MEQLTELFRRLLWLTDTTYVRFLHDQIDWSARMLGIVGIVAQLREAAEDIRLLGKVEKTYLDNTNLAYALSDSTPEIGNIRETFLQFYYDLGDLLDY